MGISRWVQESRTILDENRKALLDQQRGVEHDQVKAQWQHIVARPNLQESADGLL
jgi:hypothetical protein